MKKIRFVFILLGLVCFRQVFAQHISPHILDKPWKATWISQGPQPNRGYGVYHFRKTLALTEKPASFTVHVSADNRYKLFVNGQWVSHGPARSDLYHWNFETVDIAPFLRAGTNVLAATVWNFGEQRPEYQISHRTAFILQGDTEKEQTADTDKSWKVLKDESYQPLPPDLIYTYYAAGPGEKIDLNKSPGNWQSAGYSDAAWEPAVTLGNGLPKGVFEWLEGYWMLVPRSIPQMELKVEKAAFLIDKATKTAISGNFKKNIPPNTTATFLLDHGQLTNAYPVLKFGQGRNAKISMGYAEALYLREADEKNWKAHSQKGNRNHIPGKRFVGVTDEMTSNGNENQLFTPLMFRTYRYLQLTVETKGEPLVIEDLHSVFTGYPFERKARFDAKDAELDKILEVGWRTARLCAYETYVDCPYYEQLQYGGDTRIQALVSMFTTGDDRLVRQAINQLDNSRMAEGITLSRFPTASAQQIPTFSLLWIGMVHDFWRYSDDPAFVQGKLPGIRQVLGWFQKFQQDDATLKNVPYWNFTDWADYGKGWSRGVAPVGSDGRSSTVDLQLLWAYQLAAELENALGSKENARSHEAQAQTLKNSIRKLYWEPSRQLFAETSEKTTFSQHANTLALLTGMLAEDKTERLLADKILTDTTLVQATIYFKYYVHQAVAKAGFGDRYLDLLADWRSQLANGLTTWAEISDFNRSRSDCHAWGSSPNIEFFRIVLGIDSESPGFKKIRIAPHLGKLKNVSGTMPHPKGEISVSIQTDRKGRQTAEILIPKGTSGHFNWKGKDFELKGGEKMRFEG